MIRRIVIVATIIGVPMAFWYASQYGQPEEVTFNQAIVKATSSSESEQAPKVVINVAIESVDSDHDLQCTDATGRTFKVEFTGSKPATAFAAGQRMRLLGHVHNGSMPYFHATQRFDQ